MIAYKKLSLFSVITAKKKKSVDNRRTMQNKVDRYLLLFFNLHYLHKVKFELTNQHSVEGETMMS